MEELTIKDLKMIMEDQWNEIEELIDELDRKNKIFEGGFNYKFINYKEHKKEKDSKIYYYNEALKLDLFVNAYFKNKLIVDILIEDLTEWIDHLESNKLYNKIFNKNKKNKKDEIEKQFEEHVNFMEDSSLEYSKTTMNGLLKIYNKRLLLEEKGIENKAEIYKRVSNKARKEMKENKYNNHKKSMENEFNEYNKEQLLMRFNNTCALTGIKEDIEFDHVIPISWRVFGTTINNMIPLNNSLNASKGNRNIFKWYEANKERFNINEIKFKDAINYVAELNNMTYEQYKNFVYMQENEVIEKVKQIEQEIIKLEIEKAILDNKIFELKSETTHLIDYDV